MRVGTLEIQIMAGLARLQKDMNDAQRMVGGAMGNVERSVASAKRAMQALGVGLPIAGIVDQVRRMTDQYTKLDAQLRLATKSQAAYAQGMLDIRAISRTAQADLSATSMLYTRLINVMDGTGVAQSKLKTVTETISFGLKAYGATTQEAASAALQLSQAMGANRLGGEEFRAVMEAMPNVMKVLADSMGVPLGALRQLSIDGKITADEMVKAFGNPAIAAEFKRLAEATHTITGAWQVARNELTLLVGEFSKSTGLTQSIISIFNAFAAIFRFAADNIGILTNALLAYTTVMTGKFVVGLVQARAAQIAASVATAEAAAANVVAAEAAVFASKANLAGAAAAARAGGSMAAASAAAKEYAASVAALAVAEKAQAASSIGIMGRIKGLVGRAGWIGMALFGVWTVYDFLNGMQQVADGVDNLKNKFEGMTLAEVQMARQRELISQIGMRGPIGDVINEKEIRQSQDRIRAYDQQIAKMVDLQNAETAAQQVKRAGIQFSHDEQVIIERYNELLKQKNDLKLTEAEFAARVADIYGVGAKALKANAKETKLVSDLERERIGVMQDHMRGVGDVTQALLDQVAAQEDELARMGLTETQLVALTKLRYDEQIAIAQKRKLSAGVNEAEIVLLNEQIKQLEKLKKLAGDKLQKREELKTIAEQRKAYEDMWKSIEGVAHDTWTRVWTEGRDAFTNIGKTIKSAILDMLYQMTVKKWVIGVSATASGSVGATGMGGSSGGMGGFSIPGLDTGSGITALGNAIGSSMIAGVGTGMSLGWSGASAAASAYASAGMAMEGFALQLGAALPWVAGAIAVGSLLGVFGGSKPQSTPLGISNASFDAAGQRIATAQGVGFNAPTQKSEAAVLGMQQQYASIADALGIGRVATRFQSGLGIHADKSGIFGNIGGGAGGKWFISENVGSDEEVQLAASRAVFTALQGSQLPAYLSSVLNSIVASSATQTEIEQVLEYARVLKQTREALLETRAPLEILRANVTDAMDALGTTADRYKQDFVRAIDLGLPPETFAKWSSLGAMIEQLGQAEAAAAAEQLAATAELNRAWQSLTDSIFQEVARIRGLSASQGGTTAQFATLTAMARAGDENAAKLLPGVARAMLDVAAQTASSAVDLARIRGRTATSLETTGMTLASKYGLTIPAFATGTAEVPVDMVAQIHKGERITPKAFVDGDKEARDEANKLLREMRVELADIKRTNYRMWQIADKHDIDGMPEVREA